MVDQRRRVGPTGDGGPVGQQHLAARWFDEVESRAGHADHLSDGDRSAIDREIERLHHLQPRSPGDGNLEDHPARFDDVQVDIGGDGAVHRRALGHWLTLAHVQISASTASDNAANVTMMCEVTDPGYSPRSATLRKRGPLVAVVVLEQERTLAAWVAHPDPTGFPSKPASNRQISERSSH